MPVDEEDDDEAEEDADKEAGSKGVEALFQARGQAR